MLATRWMQAPRRLPLLFAAVMLVPVFALGWLMIQLLDRNRELETQQVRARVERVADQIVAASHQRLSDLEGALRALAAGKEIVPPADTVLVIAEGDQITVNPAGALVYYPSLPKVSEPPSDVFADGERAEFQLLDRDKAIASFKLLARDHDASIRAGALVRLGRNQWSAGRIDAALATYADLEVLGATPVDGYPAALLALEARCEILSTAGRKAELAAAAKTLSTSLSKGAWPLLADVHDYYADEARRWSGEAGETDADRDARALAGTFQSTYEKWMRADEVPQRQWRIEDSRPVLLATSSTPGRLVALMAGSGFLQGAWAGATGVQVLLTDAEGHAVAGEVSNSSALPVVRPTDSSMLPWTLRVVPTTLEPERTEAAQRRHLLLAGFAMMLVLLGGSAYFTLRGVSRELAVARLQADFVAAVSHEFRTPLASVRHLSDMLSQGRVSDETRRQECFDVLARESERLERLVEDVLDFGRLESGAYHYHREPVDVASLLRVLISEFERETGPVGVRFDVSLSVEPAVVLADRAALSRVVRNLFDNAVKYSPGTDTIWVTLSRETRAVVIRVRDRGLGIAADEREAIFAKFVRGSNARTHQIKGTGIGLAMAREIVRAHGGDITVESEIGVGSTFAVTLPMARAVVEKTGAPQDGAESRSLVQDGPS